jgi:hypothetical protein
MKRRYWAVMVTNKTWTGAEWWMHRDDLSDVYATPDVFLTRDEARNIKRNVQKENLDPDDRLEIVELAIIRSPGN